MTSDRHQERAFVSGIILAAGASTRMGRPKQLLPLFGKPLLQHVLDGAAASCLDEIVVVLGHRADEVRAGMTTPASGIVRIVVNPDYAEGQSASLRVGLRASDPRATAAAILLGDQPRVARALINQVMVSFLERGALAARPVWTDANGRRTPGHPVFLDRRLWPDVERLRGDRGARALFAARPDVVVEIDVDGNLPDDVDDWADYERMLAAAGAPAELAATETRG